MPDASPHQLPGARLHILILADRDWTHPQAGGTGTNLWQQVRHWLDWGHRVSVIAGSYPGAAPLQRSERLTLYRVGGRSTVFPHAIWRQARGMVPDADVVLEVVNGITFLTPLWCRTPRVALIHHIHRDHYVREMGRSGKVAAFMLETAPLRLLYRRARFLTISESSARDIATVVPGASVSVGYMGTEIDRFSPDPAVRAPVPTLLYLGRLKRYKRLEVLFDVLERCPGAVLEIAGDGDHRPVLETLIEVRGLADRVRMHGFVSEERKLELYRQAWINITASSAEGWGLSVTEAGACGTPSAALALGGLCEAIADGVTGVLAGSPAELAERIAPVVADPALRDSMGAAARARAAQWSWDATARHTLGLLDAERRIAHPGSYPAAGLLASEPPAPVAAAVNGHANGRASEHATPNRR
jgi:glycosyltransferase involved in cell wall biosynthesis